MLAARGLRGHPRSPRRSGGSVLRVTRAESTIATVGLVLTILSGCRPAAGEGAAPRAAAPPPAAWHAFIEDEIRTTSPDIALGNLEAQIKQLERSSRGQDLTVGQRAGLAELFTAHGQ